jgi:hypothetical protein
MTSQELALGQSRWPILGGRWPKKWVETPVAVSCYGQFPGRLAINFQNVGHRTLCTRWDGVDDPQARTHLGSLNWGYAGG